MVKSINEVKVIFQVTKETQAMAFQHLPPKNVDIQHNRTRFTVFYINTVFCQYIPCKYECSVFLLKAGKLKNSESSCFQPLVYSSDLVMTHESSEL